MDFSVNVNSDLSTVDRHLRTMDGVVYVGVYNGLNVTPANDMNVIAVPTGNGATLALAISCLRRAELYNRPDQQPKCQLLLRCQRRIRLTRLCLVLCHL